MRYLVLSLLISLAPAAAPAQEAAILIAETAPGTEAATDLPAEPDPAADAAVPDGLRILSAEGLDLAQFLWEARIVAVLANSPNDPAFLQQMRYIEAGAAALEERDVVVITDTDPAGASPLRQLLRARGFMLAIVEKDGAVAQRRPAPRDVREISAIIDRFPLRRQEMLERRPSGR